MIRTETRTSSSGVRAREPAGSGGTCPAGRSIAGDGPRDGGDGMGAVDPRPRPPRSVRPASPGPDDASSLANESINFCVMSSLRRCRARRELRVLFRKSEADCQEGSRTTVDFSSERRNAERPASGNPEGSPRRRPIRIRLDCPGAQDRLVLPAHQLVQQPIEGQLELLGGLVDPAAIWRRISSTFS